MNIYTYISFEHSTPGEIGDPKIVSQSCRIREIRSYLTDWVRLWIYSSIISKKRVSFEALWFSQFRYDWISAWYCVCVRVGEGALDFGNWKKNHLIHSEPSKTKQMKLRYCGNKLQSNNFFLNFKAEIHKYIAPIFNMRTFS